MDLHHILPQIDITDASFRDPPSSSGSINTKPFAFPSPHRLSVPTSYDLGFPLEPPVSSAPSSDHAPSPADTPSSSSSSSPTLGSRSLTPHNEQWWSGKYDFAAKIIVLGDYGVGKTSLLTTLGGLQERDWCRCISFRSNEYVEMECVKNEKRVLIRIVDTGGQERYRSITSSYFRGAHGCLLLFNVNIEESFGNVINWFHDLHNYAPPDNISCLVVGTITPSPRRHRAVTAERAFRLAESLGLTYCETHVQDEQMILWILTRLVNNVIVSRARRQSLAITIMPALKDKGTANEKKRWKCCSSS